MFTQYQDVALKVRISVAKIKKLKRLNLKIDFKYK